jgi:hypothetical protein
MWTDLVDNSRSLKYLVFTDLEDGKNKWIRLAWDGANWSVQSSKNVASNEIIELSLTELRSRDLSGQLNHGNVQHPI